MSLALGIDLGTQHLKVLFFDMRRNEVVASASAPLALDQDEHGKAEQRADWWTDALHAALDEIDPALRRDTAAISVSGQQHGFVAIDAAGDVLAPVKLWCDTATTNEAAAITAAFGSTDELIGEIGNPIMPGYTASKIRWLRDTHPALYGRMATILLPHDYLNFYLTGERCMEAGDASGTGFFNIRSRRFSTRVLAAIDPDRDLTACLPPVRVDNESIGTLQAPIAAKTGLPAGIPVAIGGGDNMMGAIGTGNVSPGTV